jgi:hypothetical protein
MLLWITVPIILLDSRHFEFVWHRVRFHPLGEREAFIFQHVLGRQFWILPIYPAEHPGILVFKIFHLRLLVAPPPRRRAHSQAFVTVNLQVFDAYQERAYLESGHQVLSPKHGHELSSEPLTPTQSWVPMTSSWVMTPPWNREEKHWGQSKTLALVPEPSLIVKR